MKFEKRIIDIFGNNLYEQAKKINKYFITHVSSDKININERVHYFIVDSDIGFGYNEVFFLKKRNESVGARCDCQNFLRNKSCKHIVACMLKYPEMTLPEPVDPVDISKNILNSFLENKTKNKLEIKQELKLDVELDLSNEVATFKLKVGLTKTYVLNTFNKFNDFVNAFNNNQKYKFGVNFTYDPDKHYFGDSNLELIKFFNGYKRNNTYYYSPKNDLFELSDRDLMFLLDKLQNSTFTVTNCGVINQIKKELPTNFNLDYKDNLYHLNIEKYEDYKIVDEYCKYVVYEKTLYIIPDIYSKILKSFFDNNISEIIFDRKNEKTFRDGLLKRVIGKVISTDNVKDIVISKKPKASLYFDFKREKIECEIKLDYNNNVINYCDVNSKRVRDEEYEQNLIKEILFYNFEIKKDKIELKNLDDIGDFLNEGLINLSEKYNIYTSKKIDNINMIKISNIKSNFSIGKDGIMSYSFSTDNIKLEELDKVLSSLNSEKKYYKLKNGNIIDLKNNQELNELNDIFNDLNINGDTSLGVMNIPKYRAFYIDSLKSNKYSIIETDNGFDKFIDNFKKYKDTKIKLSKDLKEVLRDYQKEGVKWLYTIYKCDLGGILADEMGLGKSLQTIAFIKLILMEKKDAKIMIVCPTALVYNWKREFDKFAPDLKYVTVADNKEKRKQVIKEIDKYNIFITSYGLVRNDNDEYENIDFELCIIDEAQNIKNYQSNMSREIKKIKARTKIALTGTPLENSVLELWSIFDFIMPGYLNSINKFRENYGVSDVDSKSLSKLTNLNYQISPFILRRKKKDVIKDLPDKIENNIYLELPDMQKTLYLKVLKESEEEINDLIEKEGFMKSRFKILQLLMKLRQICVDPNVLYSNYKGESVKFVKMLEIVKDYIEEGHKILIFSSFKRVVDKVKNMFDENGITSYMISGDVKSKNRMELVDKFNKDDTNCFLITLKSGGTGLNLTSADVVIHLDIWWNPQVENQATDRAHRIGQKNTVSVIKLITKGTIEERIIELQEKKKLLSDNLIEGKNNADTLSSLSEDDIKNLLAIGEDE